jgi:hypothetical protein
MGADVNLPGFLLVVILSVGPVALALRGCEGDEVANPKTDCGVKTTPLTDAIEPPWPEATFDHYERQDGVLVLIGPSATHEDPS